MLRVETKANQIANLVAFMLSLLFDPEVEGRTFFRNVAKLRPDYMASHSRRLYFLITVLRT
jgi:hypothetical protein